MSLHTYELNGKHRYRADTCAVGAVLVLVCGQACTHMMMNTHPPESPFLPSPPPPGFLLLPHAFDELTEMVLRGRKSSGKEQGHTHPCEA